MQMADIPDYWRWFNEARFGQFIHWGAYSLYGRGEQVLFREHLDQAEYIRRACNWNPSHCDMREWAAVSASAGMKYAIMTTRHHDGFCMWGSTYTDYTTAAQTAKRDFIAEYLEAFREAGLRVGLYYSLADWRIPAYWAGPEKDPCGWEQFRTYVHNQVCELLTDYGKIDVMWFDGAWPHSAETWRSAELVERMRALQPEILINNRLGLPVSAVSAEAMAVHGGASTGEMAQLGDFGTPEHRIAAEPGRLWESCQVPVWRLWGYTIGERWRPADLLLDMLVEAVGKGGNLLLNIGPTPEGEYPPEYATRMQAVGKWLELHGEAIYGSEAGDVCEFITYGRQTRKGNNLYLIIRFWDGRGEVNLGGLQTPVKTATLLTTGQELPFTQTQDHVLVTGLPVAPPTDLFPVIKLECDGPPQARDWAVDRLWGGDPARMTAWATARGSSVFTDGKPR